VPLKTVDDKSCKYPSEFSRSGTRLIILRLFGEIVTQCPLKRGKISMNMLQNFRAQRTDGNVLHHLVTVAVLTILIGLFFLPAHANSENRELYWQDFSVTAHLDNNGSLQISETQTIVFDGDWNGGERIFKVRPGQRLQLDGIYRIKPDSSRVRLIQGEMKKVDHWAWHGSDTIRWRSRLPSDPPFKNEALTYSITYNLAKILIPTENGGYLLDHDFAFNDRSGVIQHFRLELSLGDAWQGDNFPLIIEKTDIPPGRSVVVTRRLRHLAGGPEFIYRKPVVPLQRAVHVSTSAAPAWLWGSGILLLLLILIICSASFFRHEKQRGRFNPLPDTSQINAAWLDAHVFNLLPETVGATWDKSTTGHEAAAVLARLVVEKKMSSRLEPFTIPILGWRVPGMFTLHLNLLQAREKFSGYERKLIDGLFIDGDTTDTKKIRSYYRKERKSFSPVNKITKPLQKRVDELTRALQNPLEYRWLIPLAGTGSAFFILLANGFMHQNELPFTIGGGIFGLFGIIAGSASGTRYQHRSDGLKTRIFFLHLLPFLLICGSLIIALLGVSSLLLSGLLLFFASAIHATFYCAKTRDSKHGVALCQRLTAARIYFEKELRKSEPDLQDDWFPYLLAFGLGPEVDRWTRQFKATSSRPTTYHSRSYSPGSNSFTGGGGSFGGAGASGSWATAATNLGASASSSSSSSGGGGSSSGGGGGGGW